MQTNDNDTIEKYLTDHLNKLQQKFNQCTNELLTQSLSCPITLSFLNIEDRLADFVRLHHLDLLRKTNYYMKKFNNFIQETKLKDKLYTYNLTDKQVNVSQILNFCCINFFSNYDRNNRLTILLVFNKNKSKSSRR